MNVIVLDLETTRQTKRNPMQHIIEIGAVKLIKAGNQFKYHSSFQCYVLPPTLYVRKGDREFIKATKDDFKHAKKLNRAMNEFVRWIGNEPHYLCTWSESDLHILIRNYAFSQRFNLNWIQNYNDLQEKFGEMIQVKQQISLTNSLKLAGLTVKGNQHSAIDDAINTSRILMLYYPHITLEKNNQASIFSKFTVFVYSKCSKCGQIKHAKEFPAKRRSRSNRGACLECMMLKQRKKKIQKLARVLNKVAYHSKNEIKRKQRG
ncbi:inhibitor of KinA sporulation pathway (predicted exonuclease) [Evansella vedderi]|uniref:Inhibitor of KinA sporulation pathway (Predicted exonuclease) n=1 Tax=Evansella vedderi TaxID=38282 RepID=A0ABT9ZQV8_9BACI|nr:3'-5' exonuclease [Evansella vedderi]MDQ0253618.1 inhibitor of KinA sporulation pathway (predicted exonuclease) [Evansella vedderi]